MSRTSVSKPRARRLRAISLASATGLGRESSGTAYLEMPTTNGELRTRSGVRISQPFYYPMTASQAQDDGQKREVNFRSVLVGPSAGCVSREPRSHHSVSVLVHTDAIGSEETKRPLAPEAAERGSGRGLKRFPCHSSSPERSHILVADHSDVSRSLQPDVWRKLARWSCRAQAPSDGQCAVSSGPSAAAGFCARSDKPACQGLDGADSFSGRRITRGLFGRDLRVLDQLSEPLRFCAHVLRKLGR